MEVVLLVLCASLLTGVQGVKKCRFNCENDYKPVCGHDQKLGHQTFCNVDALNQCNTKIKGNNYTRVADGPCYPSVHDWSAQSTTIDERLPPQLNSSLHQGIS